MPTDECEHEHTSGFSGRNATLTTVRVMLRFKNVREATPQANGLFSVRNFGRIQSDVPPKITEAILDDRESNQQFFAVISFFNLYINNAYARLGVSDFEQCAVKGASLAAIIEGFGAHIRQARLLATPQGEPLRIEVRVSFACPISPGMDNYRDTYAKLMETLAKADGANLSSGRTATSDKDKLADALRIAFELIVVMEAMRDDLRIDGLPIVVPVPGSDEANQVTADDPLTTYGTRCFLADNATYWVPVSAVFHGNTGDAD